MLNELQKQVIIAMCQNDMSVTRTARAMHYAHNNIQYHVEHIRAQTGLNPRNFFDMIKPYEMATGGQNNGNEENL